MKSVLITIIALATFNIVHSQRFDWATSGGYSGIANSFLGAVDIAIDPDGNIYTMDSGNGQQICQGVIAEPYDGTTTFIYKFNSDGELLFISRVGAPNGVFIPFNIETDTEGNLYLLGQPNGVTSITINDETVPAIGNTNQLIKMDSSGNFLWKHDTGFASNGEGCMLQYHNGFIYYQSGDLTLSKMNPNGEIVGSLSATDYNSPTSSTGIIYKGSEVFSNGDILFAAYSRGTVSFGEDITLTNTNNPFLTAPILLVRVSEDMELDWARYLSNARDPDQNFIPVAIDANDDVYISVQVNIELTIGDDVITGDVSGVGSGTIVKINETGEDVWAKLIDETGKALGWCITASSDNTGVFIGGGYTSTIQIGSFEMPNAPNSLPFMTKFDENGNFTNAFNYLTAPSSTDAKCIEPVGNGQYIVGGKLPNTTVPVFSCTPIEAAKGFYLGSFSEQPDQAPIPTITVNGNVITASPVFDGIIEWFLDGELLPGEDGQTLIATVEGNYSVVYSYDTGCVSEEDSEVLFVSITDVSQYDRKPAFYCYPNPVSEILHVTSGSTSPIYLFDATGKIVLQQTFGTGDVITLNLSNLTAGPYILKQGTEVQLLMKD